MSIRLIRFCDDVIDRILNLIFIFVFLIGMWFVYDSYYVFNHAVLGNISGYKPTKDNPTVLKDLSEDAVAWISIENSKLDFPVMQGEDNSEYLNKDPYGEYSLAGSIFLDSRNNPEFKDDYSLIYGHHMSGDFQYGVMKHWEEKKYFYSHLDGELTLTEGKTYKLKVFAYFRCDASDEVIFNVDKSYTVDDRIQFAKKMATYFIEPAGKHLVFQSTCASPMSTERLVLAGYIVEE